MASSQQIMISNGMYGPSSISASLTSLAGFPSSFSGASNANLMVNTAASGVVFIPATQLALVMNAQNAQTLPINTTTQIKFDTLTAGSLLYSNTFGDVTIPQTGMYMLCASLGITAATAEEIFSICISDGAGNITTTLVAQDTDGIVKNTGLSTIALLTAGQTVGCFFTETGDGGKTGGSSLTTSFTIKLIA